MRYPLKQKPKAPKPKFPKRRSPIYREFIKAHDCIVVTHARMPTPCYAKPGRYKIEFCHLKTRNSGGDDIGNTFPGCPGHHDEQEGNDVEFEQRYGLPSLETICAEFKAEWESEAERLAVPQKQETR